MSIACLRKLFLLFGRFQELVEDLFDILVWINGVAVGGVKFSQSHLPQCIDCTITVRLSSYESGIFNTGEYLLAGVFCEAALACGAETTNG